MVTEQKTDENEAVIEAMVLEVEKAGEPGDVNTGGFIQKGDDDTSPVVMLKQTSAGYGTIYNTLTGESSKINLNMLRRKLRLKRADNSPVFSINPPKNPPKRGEFKCYLHSESPDRQYYNDLGFEICMKSNLTSPFQVRRHMEKKHKDEWKNIESERTERERQEDRELQRLLLSRATEAPLYVSAKDRAKQKNE